MCHFIAGEQNPAVDFLTAPFLSTAFLFLHLQAGLFYAVNASMRCGKK